MLDRVVAVTGKDARRYAQAKRAGKGVNRGEDGPTASDPTRVGRGRESRMSCCSNTAGRKSAGILAGGWERWSTKGERQNDGPQGTQRRNPEGKWRRGHRSRIGKDRCGGNRECISGSESMASKYNQAREGF